MKLALVVVLLLCAGAPSAAARDGGHRATATSSNGNSAVTVAPYPPDLQSAIAALALAGLANRDAPRLWLNATTEVGWPGYAVPVNWPYPAADSHWMCIG